MSTKRVQCATCDHTTDSPDEYGFCGSCSNEFAQVRQKLRCGKRLCITPISCLIAKKCLHTMEPEKAKA